jgi:hypothetical protein
MVKSAVVAPGASPILNLAAFSAMMAGSTHMHNCDWCPGEAAAASGCAAHMASSEGCSHAASATVASDEHAGCGASMSASHEGCTGSAATVAAAGHECTRNAGMVAAHDGCTSATKTTSAGAGCCGEAKSASAAAGDEACGSAKTASLKGVVDEMPYRENKRVVLAANPGAEGPGPIITTMAKTVGTFPIPLMVISGALTDAEIDGLS